MTEDCRWLEKNLEALYCGTLSEEESRLARAHIDACPSCRNEAHALNAIDPLIKNYFRREVAIARRSRVLHKGRVLGFAGVAATVVLTIAVLLVRSPHTDPVATPVAVIPEAAPVVAPQTPAPVKVEGAGEPARSKPVPEPAATPDRVPPKLPSVSADSPEFLLSDPAGYSHRLEEYRGHTVLMAVWTSDQTEAVANIERLYKAYAANSKLRFLGVSTEHQSRPATATFPVFYNQGSKLFGARPGEFVLFDESGSVELSGSLVKDFESLRRALQNK